MIENIQKIQITDIELIVYDFDGIMTDNKVYVDQDGREMVQVNRDDGLGISEIKNPSYSGGRESKKFHKKQ